MFRVPLALLALAAASPARADMLQAIRPGIMCTNPDALTKLSLPDGSSRTATANAPPALQAIADAGGCHEFGTGRVVLLTTARRNTSIVRADSMSGDGVFDTFIVPNIDFVPYTPPHDEFWDTIRARCPAKIENMAALGRPSYDFIESLPAPLKSAIKKTVEDECDLRVPCITATSPGEIEKRHLVPRWAAYICTHHGWPE